MSQFVATHRGNTEMTRATADEDLSYAHAVSTAIGAHNLPANMRSKQAEKGAQAMQ